MTQIYQQFQTALLEGRIVALATVIAGPQLGGKLLFFADDTTVGTLGTAELDRQVTERASKLLLDQHSERFTIEHSDGDVEIFVDVQAPPPKLIVVGAVHMAIPLVTYANELGFRTIVLDARSAFATPERFGHADELLIEWPADVLPRIGIDESTYIVFLTHDEKMDNPALHYVLDKPVRYIGALGSKKTHAKRVVALQGMGITDAQLARIHAPIGLDLGARRPEEIAVSIISEIVAVSRGKGAKPYQPQSAEAENLPGPDATVTLCEITHETVRAIMGLAVGEKQRNFVAPNARSIAEAHYSDAPWLRAIYAGETPVGLVLLYDNAEQPAYYLWRFMIDARYQGKGFGRQAMEQLIDYVRNRPNATELLVSHVPGKDGPELFYAKLGFVHTGNEQWGELEMRLVL